MRWHLSQGATPVAGRPARGLRAAGQVRAPDGPALDQAGQADGYWRLETPIGQFFVAFNPHGISAVMGAADDAAFERAFRARFGRAARRVEQPPPALERAAAGELRGERRRRMTFDLRGLTAFERAVLAKTLEIPRGEARPYAWIAREIGRPGAVRAVGSALARNPIPLLIPCHRVVRADGRIGDYALGSDRKRLLLRLEGADPDELERLASAGVRYVGGRVTRVYCFPTCRHARRVADSNRVPLRSEAEAAAAGFRPCKACRPR